LKKKSAAKLNLNSSKIFVFGFLKIPDLASISKFKEFKNFQNSKIIFDHIFHVLLVKQIQGNDFQRLGRYLINLLDLR
jgi:hypothetical protein